MSSSAQEAPLVEASELEIEAQPGATPKPLGVSRTVKVLAACCATAALFAVGYRLGRHHGEMIPSQAEWDLISESSFDTKIFKQQVYQDCFASQGADTSCRVSLSLRETDKSLYFKAAKYYWDHPNLEQCRDRCLKLGTKCKAFTSTDDSSECVLWIVHPDATPATVSGQTCWKRKPTCTLR